MKKFSFILLLFSIVFCGCTTNDELQDVDNSPQRVLKKISKEEAVVIADKVLKKQPTTRTSAKTQVSFDFVISKKPKTRGGSTSDTLAYIINYPNDEGFVIVSSSKEVFPVLGFSDKGHFSCTNENAKLNFIDKIEEYTTSVHSNVTYNIDDIDFDGCYSVNPTLRTSISQGSPWDKYVIREHPNCPVGCVAVATALVLSHSMLELEYHGSTYYFKSIIEAINEVQDPDGFDSIYVTKEWNEAVQPTYTYEQAVDSMAKFLYWIGKDLDIAYAPSGSSAFSYDAYRLCKGLKGDENLKYSTFDINSISWLLKDGYIIYLRGRDINNKGGHAWVSDGVYFCVMRNNSGSLWIEGEKPEESSEEKIIDTYIHCDWGWGGACNGYYSGSLFEASIYSFEPLNYFALKRGKNI